MVAEQLQKLNQIDRDILRDYPHLLAYKRRVYHMMLNGESVEGKKQ